jgi:hypothetical protein
MAKRLHREGRLGTKAIAKRAAARSVEVRREGLRASLRASSSGVLLGTEWLEHLSASKEARMNNLLRNYT